MKRFNPLSLLLLCAMLLGSCSKNQALFTVDTYLELSLVAGTSSQTVWGYEQQVVFPYTLQLDAFNTEDAEIMSINSSYGLVYPKGNAGIDLSFISEIVVNVLNPDDFLQHKEVFYYDQQNFNRITQIELFPSLPNIQEFVKDDRIILQIEFIFNTPPPSTFDLAFELEFGAIEIDEP